MDYSLSSLPVEVQTTPSPPKKRRHRHSKWKTGRFYVFLIFLWLRIVDIFTLTHVLPRYPAIWRPAFLCWVVVTAIWSTVLLTSVWFRQRWANVILAGSLIIVVIVNLAGIPALPDAPHPKRDFFLILEFTAAYLPVALVLIASERIRKLTTSTLKVSGDKKRNWPS